MKSKCCALLLLATSAQLARCDDLWNQQVGVQPGYASFPDQEFDDGLYDPYTTFMANDVVVAGGGWTVNSISIEVTASQPSLFGALTLARLNVFANPGSLDLPTSFDDPTQGQTTTVSVTPVAGHSDTFFVEADNLNLSLSAGEYWIDITPIGGVLTYGQCYEVFTEVNSAGALHGSAAINPLGGYMFATGSDWDSLQALNHTPPVYGAIDIQGFGAVPEPASWVVLAGAAAWIRARRRRSGA